MLDRLTDLTIESARHYQSLGVDYITVREMGSCSDLVSPRIWKTLILPRLQRVFAAIGIAKVLHICGSTNMIVAMMNECGADCLSVDQKNDIVQSRMEFGSKAVIFGNFDPLPNAGSNGQRRSRRCNQKMHRRRSRCGLAGMRFVARRQRGQRSRICSSGQEIRRCQYQPVRSLKGDIPACRAKKSCWIG